MLRWLDPDTDLPAIQAVEDKQTNPYPIAKIKKHLQNVKCCGIVVEVNNAVASYVLYQYSAHSIKILHLASLDSDHENTLIRKVVSKLRPYHRVKVFWSVPEYNLPLQLKLRDHFKFVADKIINDTIRFVHKLPRKYRRLYQGENACLNK